MNTYTLFFLEIHFFRTPILLNLYHNTGPNYYTFGLGNIIYINSLNPRFYQMPPKRRRNGYVNGYKMSAANLASYQRSTKTRKTRNGYKGAIVPGYTQRIGYYGRFSGPNQELKFHDLDVNDAVVATNGTIVVNSCNVIPQGVTESTRIGRKAVIKNILWRWNLQLDQDTANGAACTIRLILYHDRQTNGLAAPISGVGGILETNNFQSFNDLANRGRFNVLMDRMYTLHKTAGVSFAANIFSEMHINDSFYKAVNIPIEWDNTAADGSLATIRSNNIGVLILSSDSNLCSMSGKMRLRFSDV